ncbi:unnamed protein product, partial [Allacma fusca]
MGKANKLFKPNQIDEMG